MKAWTKVAAVGLKRVGGADCESMRGRGKGIRRDQAGDA